MDEKLNQFLLRAKRATYAAGTGDSAPSRPASHDLPYQEGNMFYLDTYLGGFKFIGEEAVWVDGSPVWSMNYYGWMTVDEIPEGFSPFLKETLLNVPAEAPYRGPATHHKGEFAYACTWDGTPECFYGREAISLRGDVIYELLFHGGEVK